MKHKPAKIFVMFTFFSITILTGCSFSESEMIGWYAPLNYKNTFDTIQLQSKGRYHRKVYDKSGKLVLEMNGKWSMKDEVINFESPYFFNLDGDVSRFPELLQDTVGNGGG